MHATPTVLIADRSEETREVLETALHRRGIRTFSTSRALQAAEMARSQKPDLIVLDLELDRSDPESLCSRFAAGDGVHRPSLVMLGTMRRTPTTPRGEIVSKPYHYGPLIRKIEEILGSVDRGSREAA